MSEVTDPVLLDSTGQNIVTGISAVVSAIQSRGMPSPSTSNPQMDSTASSGTSNDYARGDHVHPENPANAKTAQLAYVESGTTASRNYTAGQYIALNGLLYTADTNIALGTTLSASGGNKNLAECVGGGFNSIKSQLDSSGYIELSQSPRVIYAISGNVVTVVVWNVSPTSTVTAIATLPAEARPSTDMRFTGHCDAYGRRFMEARIYTTGSVSIQAESSYNFGYATCTYVK